MRILLASSEVYPYSKTGGLADMVGALAKALAEDGLEVGVVTPLYRGVASSFPQMRRFGGKIEIPLGASRVQARVHRLEASERLTIYFIEQPGFFERAGLYQERGEDYPDNVARFIFFSKCVVQLARGLRQRPEVLHLHDWQTALVPAFVQQLLREEEWRNVPRTCLTIHNLAYQGNSRRADFGLTNLPDDYFNPEGVEFYGGMSCLKAGIVYADMITTVSPRYAREITTEEFGCGLDGVLRNRLGALIGILNGVDYAEWKTEGNPFLPFSYSPRDMQGKTAIKLALQAELGLPVSVEIPLFGNVTRLVEQKGMDALLAALEEVLVAKMQFVLLGSGAAAFENAFRDLARRHPNKVSVRIGYDQPLSHRIEAACDFYLMPSKFEPCGLNQLYSLHYGTVPVVRATGGLDDSVIDPRESRDQATGIKFSEYSPQALAKAIEKALALYGTPPVRQHFQRNGMQTDFSWDRTRKAYVSLYEALLSASPRTIKVPD